VPKAKGQPGEPASGLGSLYEQGLEIEARSVWRLALRRFLRHRLAMASLVVLIVIFLAGIFAGTVAPYSYSEINLPDSGVGPALGGFHIFGTDDLGRDYFSRVVYGIRTTESVAIFTAFLTVVLGAFIGSVAGYFGGWIDNILMRFTDLLLTLPTLAVLLTASALINTSSPTTVAILLALLFWTSLARIVRGSFLSLKEKEYIEAARASGASHARIILRHMLPNSLGPIIVNGTLTVALAVLIEASLSFLGFGIKPPTPSLGSLISDGKGQMLTEWWLVTFPGLVIVIICLCINFIGDGLRDALDPTQQRVRA
jgi:peptide/nickel transport system permease protein